MPFTRPRGSTISNAAALLALVAVTVLILGHYGAGRWNTLWYLFVFAVAVVVPGTLLSRALLGTRGNLLSDVAVGTGVGIIAQFALWFIFVSLGIGPWLWVGCLAIYLPFLIAPRLRGHWFPPGLAATSPHVTWAITGVYALTMLHKASGFAITVPPAATSWYPDMYWHLGNSAGLLTRAIPQDMRLAGEPFNYHWFSSAHAAAMSLTSGIEITYVFGYLWLPTTFLAAILIMVELVRQLTTKWWPGIVAALMILGTAATFVPAWAAVSYGSAFMVFSPSQNFSTWGILLTFSVLVQYWRAGRLPLGGWLLLAASLLFAAGAKASTLPVVICGLALGLLVDLLRRRGWVRMGLPLVMAVAAMFVTLPLVSGGAAGTKVQVLSSLRRTPQYFREMGLTGEQQSFARGLFPPELLTPTGLVTAVVVLGTFAVGFMWLVTAVPVLRKDERSSAGWVLLGTGIAGVCAAMLVDQDGMSQVYFYRGALVAWYALAAWGLSVLVDRALASPQDHAQTALRICAAGAAGAVYAFFWRGMGPIFGGLSALVVACLVMLVPVAVGAVLAWRSRADVRPTRWAMLAVAAVAASTLPGLIPGSLPGLPKPTDWSVSAPESAAAYWLRSNSEPDQIVATNVHCRTISQVQPCENDSFWVSGFSQRPVLIEGWAYTNSAHARHGVNGLSYSRQPYEDGALFALNEAAFTAPSQQVMDDLRAKGVAFLFADDRRGDLSPDIGEYATLVFENEDVRIFALTAD